MTNFPSNQQFQKPVPTPNPDKAPDDDVIDLSVLFSAIWRGKWLICLVAILAVLAGGYYAFVAATPLYRSTAVVILETEQQNIVDLQGVVGGLTGDTSEVNSEVEVLRSRGLMGKVVDRLNLIEDPEFNGSLRPTSPIDGLKNQVKTVLGVTEPALSLSPEEQARRERDSVVTELLDQVVVRNVPLSLVFQVTVESEQAEKSALIADTIVELYVLNQLEVKFEATEQATTWLADRVSELQVQLEDAEAKLADFSKSTELVSVEALQAQEVQLKDLRDRISSAEETEIVTQARLEELRAAQTRADRAALSNDPQLRRFLTRAQTDSQMADAFDTRFEQVLTRAELDMTRNRQQVEALKNSEIELTDQISRQGQDLITLQQLTREAEAIRLLYEYFLTRLKETAAQQGIQQADSRILSNSIVAAAPASPRKTLILGMSGVLGVMFGIALVLLREARQKGFRTARDLEAHTGYTVLGQVPQIPARSRKNILKYLADKPTSAAAEAVRNLRTSVLLSNVDNPPKVIVSTSSVPGEGKTTNSLALAQNLIGLGKSVLLIEGDIRRRTFSQYFDGLPPEGLVAVLGGEIELDDAIFRTDGFGADILVGEKSNTNAADLFASDRFKALIADVRERYDTVIIDTPPVLVVPDARIIAQVADAVLFTVHWDRTSKQQIDESLRTFHNSNQRITGLVLSQINPSRMKAYGYGGRYGAYAGYGAKYYNN